MSLQGLYRTIPFFILSSASLGLGALVGLLMGMSTSPVVAATLGAMVPFSIGFATWFSTKRAPQGGASNTITLYSLAVGGFSWGAVIFTCLGVAIRTHDWLSPTPTELVTQWKTAGFSEEEARHVISASFLKSSTPDSGDDDNSGQRNEDGRRSVLYSFLSSETIRDLKPMIGEADLEMLKSAFSKKDGPLKEAVLHVERKGMTNEQQKSFLEDFFLILEKTQ